MKRLLLLPTLALLAACGGGGKAPATPKAAVPPQATPAPAPTPTPWAPGLLTVLRESRPADGSQGTDEVVVADRAGALQARASFSAPARPSLTNAADLLQSPVRVAAGSVFFADASGVVRRLGGDGRVTTVATFPVTEPTRQELSFGVSPDGRKLMASILTPPPAHVPPPADPSQPFFADGGRWTLELFTADAGGTAVSTLKKDLGAGFPQPTIVVGWDRSGPLATLNTNLAAQDAPVSERFTGDALVHLGPDGSHLDQLGGAGCWPLDELPDGTTVCTTDGLGRSVQVRSAGGQLLWQAQRGDSDLGGTPRLSPDGGRIATGITILSRAGAKATLGPASNGLYRIEAEGWLDAQTVVVGSSSGRDPLRLVDVGHPTQAHDLPIDGKFVGTL